MRALLLTGKGGVGKTTVAAATAVHSARQGLKTLVISTDAAHSLADAFAAPISSTPTELEAGLYAQQVETQRAFELGWRAVSAYLRDLLEQGGIDPLEADELTVLPGAEELLALLELRNQARAGRWDVIVVDCAPTGETLRLLGLPDALSWWLRRIFPAERRAARALRPVMSSLIGLPVPPDTVFAAAERLCAELADVRELLTAPDSSIRLVLTPESMVLAEARRAATSLSLYGYRVDGVIVNRVFPQDDAAATGEWARGWAAAHASRLEEIAASFPGLPLWRAAYAGDEPIGLAALAELATTAYDGTDPLATGETPEPVCVERVGTEEFTLTIALPHALPEQVDLARKGTDLLLTVAGVRRVLPLPSALQRCVIDGAGLIDGRLIVRFSADPDLWLGR